jgi:hypothetical protein
MEIDITVQALLVMCQQGAEHTLFRKRITARCQNDDMYYWYKESFLKTFDPEDKYMKKEFDARIGLALMAIRTDIKEWHDEGLEDEYEQRRKEWRENSIKESRKELGNQFVDELIRFCREDDAGVR